jgi:hypothetical protein
MEIPLPSPSKEQLLLAQIFEWQMETLMDVLEETHGINIDRPGAIQALRDRIAGMRREQLIRAVEKGPHEDPGR